MDDYQFYQFSSSDYDTAKRTCDELSKQGKSFRFTCYYLDGELNFIDIVVLDNLD